MKKLLFSALLLVFCPLLILAQTRQIKGTVLDGTTKNGVIASTVKIKNAQTAVITDEQGKFSIDAPTGNVILVVSSMGYETIEVNVGANEGSVSISLKEENNELNAVVVTALGISKQSKKLGYAITTVNGDQMNKARENNIGNSLTGRVAGLKVSSTSSGPGGTAKMFLRGNPSLTGSGQPLFVINGVPMDNTQRGSAGEWGGSDGGDGIGNINPDDVESMTVLKGQSASALYGARATNGVILITTKSAKKGEFAIDYNMNYMVERAMDETNFQYVYGQGTGGLKPVTQAGAQQTARMSWGARLDGTSVIQFDGKSYPYSASKDNIKNFYRPAPSITHSVAIMKGGQDGTFRLSMSTLNGDA
ncbi:MAG: TonB-dependent receptor plug domain-containing protein, partial [Chitinophagaceae bacterium]|nr:TonB-dependent receptor plug domain-containing protein [Chitinophagaceae bacterium]